MKISVQHMVQWKPFSTNNKLPELTGVDTMKKMKIKTRTKASWNIKNKIKNLEGSQS